MRIHKKLNDFHFNYSKHFDDKFKNNLTNHYALMDFWINFVPYEVICRKVENNLLRRALSKG